MGKTWITQRIVDNMTVDKAHYKQFLDAHIDNVLVKHVFVVARLVTTD